MIEPVHVHPNALYDDGALHQALGLSKSTLLRARRAGELRYKRVDGRVLYLGAWVMAWLEAGATPKPTPSPED